MAIINDKPRPASQADIVNITMGNIIGAVDENFKAQSASPIKIANIILSKHRRADNK